MSKAVDREQCPACASRGQDTACDNLVVYDDGHKFCYACKYRENRKGMSMVLADMLATL